MYNENAPPDDSSPRTIEARIDRLRKRVTRMSQKDPQSITVAGILLGLLDLLDDEL